jgi:hypothetical protein
MEARVTPQLFRKTRLNKPEITTGSRSYPDPYPDQRCSFVARAWGARARNINGPSPAIRTAGSRKLTSRKLISCVRRAVPICKGELWVCEVHPLVPWYGGTMECCDGPAVPCRCNLTSRMPPGFKVHCSVNEEVEQQPAPHGPTQH